MVIDQRNAGASVTNTASAVYAVDRFPAYGTVSSKYTAQQNAGSVTPPAGFTNYLGITSISAYSVLAGDFFMAGQRIEGYNVADFGWGTANAKTVTLSFWVRSSLTGTFGGSLVNNDGNRSYPYTYTISTANTWEQKSVTITGDTSGTWLTNNGNGLALYFGLGCGSTWSGTAGSWSSNYYFTATGATSVVGTNGATFYITGVQLEVGSTATSFDYRPYGTELALCQRYYQKSYDTNSAVPVVNSITGSVALYKNNTIDSSFIPCRFKVEMRTTPTVTTYDYQGTAGFMAGGSFASLTATVYQQGTSGFNVVSGTGNPNYDSYVNYAASAEL
jgi:hypothetical protein